jgi:hypothetical protein
MVANIFQISFTLNFFVSVIPMCHFVSQINVSCHFLKGHINYPYILYFPAFGVTRHECLLSFLLKELLVAPKLRICRLLHTKLPHPQPCAFNQRRRLCDNRGGGGGRAKCFLSLCIHSVLRY